MEEDVDGEDNQHQHHHHLGEQIAEAADAALELGLRWTQGQPLGNLAEGGSGPRLDDQRASAAGAHVGAHKDAVGALGQAGLRRHGVGCLCHREGLAR